MGILDDAIREHLDLKRRLGAREAEVKRLEDEAFGPPARPGEPEFGEAAQGDAVELRVPPELAVPDVDEQSPAEQARVAHPELEDTDSHAPFDDSPLPAETEAPATEPDVEAEDFDVGDLNLAIEDEPATALEDPKGAEAAEPIVEAPEQDSPTPPPIEPPDPGVDDLDDFSVEETAPEAEPPSVAEPAPQDSDEAGDGGEDLLEETPEFLRDAPESDQLWFEQGEPEDFDFDDEEP